MINTSELFQYAPDTSSFLSVLDIVTEFRVSRFTVYRLIKCGAFPDIIRVSRCYRIPRSNVLEFIERGGQWA